MLVAAAVEESSEIAGTDFYGAKVEVDLTDTAIVIAPRPVNFQRAQGDAWRLRERPYGQLAGGRNTGQIREPEDQQGQGQNQNQ